MYIWKCIVIVEEKIRTNLQHFVHFLMPAKYPLICPFDPSFLEVRLVCFLTLISFEQHQRAAELYPKNIHKT